MLFCQMHDIYKKDSFSAKVSGVSFQKKKKTVLSLSCLNMGDSGEQGMATPAPSVGVSQPATGGPQVSAGATLTTTGAPSSTTVPPSTLVGPPHATIGKTESQGTVTAEVSK